MMPVEQRKTEWWDYLRVSVLPARERPDAAIWQGDTMFVLKDFFTTRDGSWEPIAGLQCSVPAWARASYNSIPWGQPGYFDDAGGATHLFGAVLGLDGQLKREWSDVLFWLGKEQALRNLDPGAFVKRATKASGWANIPIEHGSWYDPALATGAWSWAPIGLSDVLVGGGLPMSWHVSMFAVWQEVSRTIVDPGEPPPAGTDLAAILAELRGIRSDLRQVFRIQ